MALQLKIRIVSKSADLTQVYVRDDNEALFPENRYGVDGNAERADLGLFLYVWKKGLNDTPDERMYVANIEPMTAIQWVYVINQDNVYEHFLVGAPIYSDVVEYAIGSVVVLNDRLYLALSVNLDVDPSTNPLAWAEVTDDPDAIRNSGNEATFYQTWFREANCDRAQVYFAKYIAEITADGHCEKCDDDKIRKKNRIETLIQAVQVNEYQEKWLQAQAVIEALKTMYAL